jgi:hypothetical protein
MAHSHTDLVDGKASQADQATVEALAFLFATLSGPLVLKHDNGGAFTAASVAQVIHDFGVTPLVSHAFWRVRPASVQDDAYSLLHPFSIEKRKSLKRGHKVRKLQPRQWMPLLWKKTNRPLR